VVCSSTTSLMQSDTTSNIQCLDALLLRTKIWIPLQKNKVSSSDQGISCLCAPDTSSGTTRPQMKNVCVAPLTTSTLVWRGARNVLNGCGNIISRPWQRTVRHSRPSPRKTVTTVLPCLNIANIIVLHNFLLAFWGTPIGELWDLEELARLCEKHQRYSFFVTSAPLNLEGGIASPANAMAIF